MLKITVTVEKEIGPDDRGYDRTQRVAEFVTNTEDIEVWAVYRQAVEALTPEPPARTIWEREE